MAESNACVSKFAFIDVAGNERQYPHEDRWSTQRTTGSDRLVVAPARGHHVDTLLDLARCLREPFCILYVLVLPRTGEHATGRYQSPFPTNRADTEAFVNRFRDYLEGDARHHLWLMSLPDSATLVYDNHDLLYAYGPLDKFRNSLAARGFREGRTVIPFPHSHRYNDVFDDAERDVMRYWEWRRSPLQPEDET
jgi:hypothetical protein